VNPITLRIYVVRHAQPADQEPDYPGSPNAPLGRTGKLQAECVGEQFARWGQLDAMYSSSLQRALQTAEPIHRRLGVPWHVWPALCETHRRGWPAMRQLVTEGTYKAYAAEAAAGKVQQSEHYPLLSQMGNVYPGAKPSQAIDWPDVWQPGLEAETREKTYERAGQVIAALRKSHEGADARIAVVCHAAFGSVLLTQLMGCEPCDHNRFSFSHAAIARIDVEDDGTPSLRMLNDVSHIPLEIVTEGVEL
jgi:broad specificity phosphatase PhoE